MKAVKQNGDTLAFLELKGDREVVTPAAMHFWALLLKRQGAVMAKSDYLAQYYYHMLWARLGMGEGERANAKCWKQSLDMTPEGTQHAPSVNVQLLRLRKDLRTGLAW